MGDQTIKKYDPKEHEEINANEVFMQEMKRSYPEFAKALEEFMEEELKKIEE